MFFFGALLINSMLLVAGQSLFKLGVDRVTAIEAAGTTTPSGVVDRISPYIRLEFIAGLFIYGVGTVMYILLLKKYGYFVVQSVMLSVVLILATASAYFLFSEEIKMLQFVGVAVMILGIILIAR